jgi:fatty-acyl-CoA synthase
MEVALALGDFLRRGALVYPDRVAVYDEPGEGSLGALTHGELAARAAMMAASLDRLGIEPGERVAIVSPNSARFLISLFGVSCSGRVLVPINFRLARDEVRYILEHSGARLLLVDPEYATSLGGQAVEREIVLDRAGDDEMFASEESSPRDWDPDELAIASVNYTSGTTARPKGVALTHRNLWLDATVFALHLGVTDRDVYLHTLPMFHVNGWSLPYALTGLGVPQVVLRRVDGEDILRRVDHYGVTLFCGAPAVAAAILDAATLRQVEGRPVPGAGRVRIALAGAPPPSRTIERIEAELGWEFIQLYGLTETSPVLTVNRSRSEWDELDGPGRARKLARAGAAALGVEVRTDESGEVLARSNHVFAGYWKQPEATAEAIVNGWFRTGDEGFMDGENYLSIADRKKDVIITGGENVSSVEVEDCLYQHPAVKEVAVIGVPDERWGETVKALVVPREECNPTEAELIEHCRALIAHFKCPTSVELRTELPRTATGKLQKFKLRDPYWAGMERRVN